MPRLLIITAWYAPFIHPRAHRWTALAEYWASQGHEVHVVCARRRGFPREAKWNGVAVHRVGWDSWKEVFYALAGESGARGRPGARARKPGRAVRLLHWFYRVVRKSIPFPDDALLWCRPARRRVLELLEGKAFDAVLSVSLPFSGHLAGLAAKRRHPTLFWLADVGDPFAVSGAFSGKKGFARLEKRVLESADAVSVTTDATRRKFEKTYGLKAVKRMHVIPPLLHPFPADWNPKSRAVRNSRIKIGYFGALYAPVRMPDALLFLLEKTRLERPSLAQRLAVHCYGEIFPEFLQALENEPLIRLHGLRPRAEAEAAMQHMDVLLNIGNRSDFQLPSKAVDYLATGKPLINLSRAEPDPFADFCADWPVLLNVRVDPNGQVADTSAMRFWAFLENLPAEMSDEARLERVKEFGVEAIGKQYWQLIGWR